MKRFISMVFASVLGGVLTLGSYLLLNGDQSSSNLEYKSYAKQVNNINKKVGSGFSAVPFDFTEAAEKATPAVVHISAKAIKKESNDKRREEENPLLRFFDDESLLNSPFFNFDMPQQGSGSGVIYTQDGYIITNNHVVEFADEVEVTTHDNKVFDAKIVGTYPQGDLAVLKIDAKGLPTIRLADSDAARIGEWVLAVGNPLDLASTVTAGIISAKGRDINIIQDDLAIESFIQTDAAVNPGNSGGALVDAYGNLLGINTAIATKTGFFQGYSFAIPINLAVKIVDDIIENGSYQRGFLGINIADLDNGTAETLGLSSSQGVLVANVVNGGAAQFAGILTNDVIIEVDNKKVRTTPELLELVGGLKAGDTVVLTVNRKGDIKTMPVRLKAAN